MPFKGKQVIFLLGRNIKKLRHKWPYLSCYFSCNKLFHPVCVGLMEGPDYSGFDFYCADCPPPLGQETVEMPPPIEEMMDVDVSSNLIP